MIAIRSFEGADRDALWAILEPVIRAGEVFALPVEMTREQAFRYFLADGNRVFVAEEDGLLVGAYYLRANQMGGGAHVANCGYVTAGWAGGRGVASAMCRHSLEFAKSVGFRAMQFNFVVSTNEAAVHLWRKHGFRELARLPGAFRHPALGFVDALVMWREL
ncbi:GNAT family N-acetyltransferase [Acidicapsa acidisoli]|uniref:GNAT family N-acetyltransferase n=1 Tax=Acidicapsa acidisoli TaxID=1615681 RepID=UPI0021DFC716|nr:GNAT family N-acetyltransferase [Acidicapsa acidisoli]